MTLVVEMPKGLRMLIPFLTLALTVLSMSSPPLAAAQDVTFDWSVPARFGMDSDGNGLIDYFTTQAAIDPDSWPVDLTACGITLTGRRVGTSASFRWRMTKATTGVLVADVMRVNACTARVNVPAEGRYIANLTISYSSVVGPQTLTFGRLVDVRDFLIIGMGDSAASGEGTPDIFAPSAFVEETWQNRQCHRSAKSGQALAAKQLEDLDTKTSVTFVHVACSGAKIADGLLGSFDGAERQPGEPVVPSQVQQIQGLVGDRRIDAILVSIGINDLNWGLVLGNCILQVDCNRNTPGFDFAVPDLTVVVVFAGLCTAMGPLLPVCLTFTANAALVYTFVGTSAQIVQDQVGSLNAAFDELALAIERDLGVTTASRVYIAGYLDPTRDEAGDFCNPDNYGVDLFRTLFGLVSRDEFAWAGGTALTQINNAISASAGEHGWTFVNGVPAAFLTGGICATAATRAVRRFDESLSIQHDHQGLLHPNTRGYQHYRDRYMALLRDRFAPVGNWTFSPRQQTINVNDKVPYVLEWKHPNVWRDLTSLELRASSGNDTAFWIRWDEGDNTFRLVRSQTEQVGPPHEAGSEARLETAFATLHVAGSTAKGSGPTGPSVAVTFDLSFKNRAAARQWKIEIRAIDDSGAIQEFEEVGTVFVTP